MSSKEYFDPFWFICPPDMIIHSDIREVSAYTYKYLYVMSCYFMDYGMTCDERKSVNKQ